MTSEVLRAIEVNLDIEEFITEVHNRPALWDMTHKDYSDRIKRKQSWEEIIEHFGVGRELTLDDKNKLGKFYHLLFIC